MSKQSNQRYRKEKKKDHLKKAGIEDNSSVTNTNAPGQNKINHEFGMPSDRIDK